MGKGEIALKESKDSNYNAFIGWEIFHQPQGNYVCLGIHDSIGSSFIFFCSNILANISLLHAKKKERAATAQFKSNLL
jgi:hypothetical protein